MCLVSGDSDKRPCLLVFCNLYLATCELDISDDHPDIRCGGSHAYKCPLFFLFFLYFFKNISEHTQVNPSLPVLQFESMISKIKTNYIVCWVENNYV